MNGNLNENARWVIKACGLGFIYYVRRLNSGYNDISLRALLPQPGETIDVNVERENLYLPSLPFRLWVCRLDYGLLNT